MSQAPRPCGSCRRRSRSDPAGSQDVQDIKEQALFARWRTARRSSSPTAAASTAPISPRPPRAFSAPRPLRHRRQPQLSRSPSRARAARSPRDFGLEHEVIHTNEMARPEYRANPANRCYYCKHELYTHLSAHRARARHSGHRRRQQRRRSRRLSPRPPGGARVRRRQPARRGRADQGRDPRAVAARRAADLGRAGVGVPVVAHSVLQRSHRREAADDRAGGGGAARSRLPHLPRAPPRDTDPIARLELGRDEMARALEPDVADAIDRELRALGYRHVTLDLRGYRLGSLNDALRLRQI